LETPVSAGRRLRTSFWSFGIVKLAKCASLTAWESKDLHRRLRTLARRLWTKCSVAVTYGVGYKRDLSSPRRGCGFNSKISLPSHSILLIFWESREKP
jgi:hypothetical protein